MSYLCHISNKKKCVLGKSRLKSAQLTRPQTESLGKPRLSISNGTCHVIVWKARWKWRTVNNEPRRVWKCGIKLNQTGLNMTQPYWKEYYTRWKGLRPCWRWKGLIFSGLHKKRRRMTPMILLTSLGGNLWQFTAAVAVLQESIFILHFGLWLQPPWHDFAMLRMPKHRAPDPFLIYVLRGVVMFVGAYKVLS